MLHIALRFTDIYDYIFQIYIRCAKQAGLSSSHPAAVKEPEQHCGRERSESLRLVRRSLYALVAFMKKCGQLIFTECVRDVAFLWTWRHLWNPQ